MLTQSQLAKLNEYKNKAVAKSTARKRLELLFDDGVYTELDVYAKSGEDLTGVISAYGYVDGSPIYAFSQDKDVMGGAVNKQHSEKICKIYDLAARTGVPVVGIFDSNGTYVDDGADALNYYGEILTRTSNLSGVVPQVSVIAGVCSGSAAMIACSADFVIMTEDAQLYMSPSSDLGKAKTAAVTGTAAIIGKDDSEAMNAAKTIITLMPANNIAELPEFDFAAPSGTAEGDAEAIVNAIADAGSVIELYDDFGKASYVALASVGGSTIGIAATNKTNEKLTSDDSAKLARFVRTCDAFSIPVLTIVDTEGFDSEGSIKDMTKLAHAYAEATTLKISLITGNAIGAACVALASANANADVTFAYANAVISPIAPLTAIEFLMHDKLKGAKALASERNKLAADYAENSVSAFNAADKGCISDIITSAEAREKIISVLDVMSGKRMMKTLPKKHSNMPL